MYNSECNSTIINGRKEIYAKVKKNLLIQMKLLLTKCKLIIELMPIQIYHNNPTNEVCSDLKTREAFTFLKGIYRFDATYINQVSNPIQYLSQEKLSPLSFYQVKITAQNTRSYLQQKQIENRNAVQNNKIITEDLENILKIYSRAKETKESVLD